MRLQDILAQRLREIRQARGLTIQQFAEELAIARSSLQSILRGNSNPRIDTVELIAQNLHMTPAELLSEPKRSPEEALAQKAASLPSGQRALLAAYLTEIAKLLNGSSAP